MKTRIKVTLKYEDGEHKSTWYEPEVYDFWLVNPFKYQSLVTCFRMFDSMEEISESYGGYEYGSLQFAQAMIDHYIQHRQQKPIRHTEEIEYVKYPDEG